MTQLPSLTSASTTMPGAPRPIAPSSAEVEANGSAPTTGGARPRFAALLTDPHASAEAVSDSASGKDLPADAGSELPDDEEPADAGEASADRWTAAAMLSLPHPPRWRVEAVAASAGSPSAAPALLPDSGRPATPMPPAGIDAGALGLPRESAPRAATLHLLGSGGEPGAGASPAARVQCAAPAAAGDDAYASAGSIRQGAPSSSDQNLHLAQLEDAVPTAELLRSKAQASAPDHSESLAVSPEDMDAPVSPSLARRAATSAAAVPQVGRKWADQPVTGAGLALAAAQPAISAAPASPDTFGRQIAQPLDLEAVIDRLVEARQSAAGDRLQMLVAHREFGQIGIRFEQSASLALGVALTSSDPAFAPAVQAALNERTQAERQAAASDQQSQSRSDQPARGETFAQGGQPQAHHSHSSADHARAARPTGAEPEARSPEHGGKDASDTAGSDARGLYA